MSFCSSLVLVPKKSTLGFSQKHAKRFKAQVCTQLLAAMTDPALPTTRFQRKAGKTFAPSASAKAKMKAAPKKKSEKDLIAEDEHDEEIEDEEDVEEENLSEVMTKRTVVPQLVRSFVQPAHDNNDDSGHVGSEAIMTSSPLGTPPFRASIGAAGLQGGRQRPDRTSCCRPSTLPLRWTLRYGSPPGRSHHSSPGRRPRRQGRADRPALHGGRVTPVEVDTKLANALLGLATKPFVAAQLASRDASISALQGAKADTSLLASYATNAALSASKTTLQSALDAILAELHLDAILDRPGPTTNQITCAGGVPLGRRPGHGNGLEHRSRPAQLLQPSHRWTESRRQPWPWEGGGRHR